MRQLLTSIVFAATLATGIFAAMITTVYAQEDAADSEKPKFLAIQHAQSGKITKINETIYSLELNDVSQKTILFSDRPDRIVTTISTLDFIGNWDVGEDSFAADPPNAVLVVGDIEQQDVAVVELSDPKYDSNTNMLEYAINIDSIDSIESIQLPDNFGQSTLIIDPINNGGPWTGT